jgi:hypothetical protein
MAAHSIKNPHIKHFIESHVDEHVYFPNGEWGKKYWISYLCCGSFTASKATGYESEVTCKNCLRKLSR